MTQAIPSLFSGLELNPVAPGAQRKVPLPEDLDFDTPINPHLKDILSLTNDVTFDHTQENESYNFYHQRPQKSTNPQAAADRLPSSDVDYGSYQQSKEEEVVDANTIARLKAERQERYKDDPFYIAPENEQNSASPIHNILRSTQSAEVDIDAIPVMELEGTNLNLQQEGSDGRVVTTTTDSATRSSGNSALRKPVEILVDETLGMDEPEETSLQGPKHETQRPDLVRPTQGRAKKSLLQVDSSGLGALSLNENNGAEAGDAGTGGSTRLDIERREAEEAEMARALQEVERLRLEMQRAAERIQARDAPPDGVLVQKKKKKRRKVVKVNDEDGDTSAERKAGNIDVESRAKGTEGESNVAREENGNVGLDTAEAATRTKKKKKKKREVKFVDGVDDKVAQEKPES